MARDDLKRRKPIEHSAQDQADAVYPKVDVPTESTKRQKRRYFGSEAAVVSVDHCLGRPLGMQVDGHAERFGAFKYGPEELVVKVTSVDVAIDQCAHEAQVADGALELAGCRRRVDHWQCGKSEESVRILRDRRRYGIVRQSSKFPRERRLKALCARRRVREDLHIDTGLVHKSDPPLAQIKDARWAP